MPNYEELSDEQRKNRVNILEKLLTNPEVSGAVKRAITKVDPTIKFADVEQDDRTAAQLAARDKKIDELQAAQMEADATRRREAAHVRARERGLDPAEVEKTITEYKIADWDKAMDITDRLTHAAPATPESFDNVLQMPDMKGLWEDPDKWARAEAHKSVDEMLKGRRAQSGR